jgi:hypothetical protein
VGGAWGNYLNDEPQLVKFGGGSKLGVILPGRGYVVMVDPGESSQGVMFDLPLGESLSGSSAGGMPRWWTGSRSSGGTGATNEPALRVVDTGDVGALVCFRPGSDSLTILRAGRTSAARLRLKEPETGQPLLLDRVAVTPWGTGTSLVWGGPSAEARGLYLLQGVGVEGKDEPRLITSPSTMSLRRIEASPSQIGGAGAVSTLASQTLAGQAGSPPAAPLYLGNVASYYQSVELPKLATTGTQVMSSLREPGTGGSDGTPPRPDGRVLRRCQHLVSVLGGPRGGSRLEVVDPVSHVGKDFPVGPVSRDGSAGGGVGVVDVAEGEDGSLFVLAKDQTVRLVEVDDERLWTQLDDWKRNFAMRKEDLQARARGAGKEPAGTSVPKTGTNLPKHGKEDPKNDPHVGGNTWAGGTGGSDTAGLGGRGGPYRLDKGHKVFQVRSRELGLGSNNAFSHRLRLDRCRMR